MKTCVLIYDIEEDEDEQYPNKKAYVATCDVRVNGDRIMLSAFGYSLNDFATNLIRSIENFLCNWEVETAEVFLRGQVFEHQLPQQLKQNKRIKFSLR